MPRAGFAQRLDQLVDALGEMLGLVEDQFDVALDVLNAADGDGVGEVIDLDRRVDACNSEIDRELLELLALQGPVAGDLRLVLAVLQANRHIERIGDQCVNIAKSVSVAGDVPENSDALVALLREIGERTRVTVELARHAVEDRDPTAAPSIDAVDAEVRRLNRSCLVAAVEVGGDRDARRWALSMVLVARALERIAENAGDVARQIAFGIGAARPAVERGRAN